ncbi:MAG: DUF805 domain-containing protein [Pseudomonadota bacterium]
MSFIRAITSAFSKYVSVEGRANRREFWFWIAFCVCILLVATIVDGAIIGPARGFLPFEQDAGRPLAITMLALLVVPTLTAAVRRLHDSDKSGWWLLIGFTVIGLVPLAYFLIKSAKKTENRYDS